MRRRAGFTLLEMLLASTLLTLLTTAALSWMSAQSRSTRAANRDLHALVTAQAVARAIQDDLLAAISDPVNKGQRYALEGQRLRCKTLNHIPGDPPGIQTVRWRQDAALGALVREIIPDDPRAKPLVRVVSRDLRLRRFGTGEGTGILFFIYSHGTDGPELRLPVTRAGMP